MLVHQLDARNVLTWSRDFPEKSDRQVLVTPTAKRDGYACRWVTDLDPVQDCRAYGTEGTGAWEEIEDHSEGTLWLAHGQAYTLGADADGKTYDGLGPLPAWLYADEPPAPEPTLDDLRAAKKAAATAKRWEVMTGGMTLPNGVHVGTSVDDQNRITSVVANADLAGFDDGEMVDFKAASGWVQISIGDIKQIAGLIGQRLQACYSVEHMHHDAIDALPDDRAAIEAYDVTTGWPSDAV